jgi:Fe-S cluster biogenesis protein NfuA
MRVQSVQPTPNPNAFKFLLDARVVASGVKNYTSAAEARGDRLAESLFAVEGVDTLFFCDNFITVSMTERADWRGVHDEVVRILQAHTGDPLESQASGAAPPPATAAAAPTEGDVSDPELLGRINELLDDRVRPALAGDGGGLEILGLSGKTLRIRYQGACGSCPSSIAGTLTAIQSLLQSEIDETLQVVSG